MGNANWLDTNEYPFNVKTIEIESSNMSYVDEGQGSIILCIHGTPSWSFEYRKIIQKLSSNHRIIAPDQLGFGLSAKPEGIDYTPAGHAARLEQFIKALNLSDIHLVVHDFGGPIGLAVLLKNPELFSKVTIMNTWCWSLSEYEHFSKPAKIISSKFGKFLYERLNFSANVLLKSGFANKKNLPKKIHRQYKMAQDKHGRKAAHHLALSLLGASDWYDSLWTQIDKISHLPIKILWGMADTLLPADLLLPKWRTGLPKATIIEIKEAGHFPQEENPEVVINALLN